MKFILFLKQKVSALISYTTTHYRNKKDAIRLLAEYLASPVNKTKEAPSVLEEVQTEEGLKFRVHLAAERYQDYRNKKDAIRRARKEGILAPSDHIKKAKITPQDVFNKTPAILAAVVAASKEGKDGMRLTQISKDFGMSRSTARAWLARLFHFQNVPKFLEVEGGNHTAIKLRITDVSWAHTWLALNFPPDLVIGNPLSLIHSS